MTPRDLDLANHWEAWWMGMISTELLMAAIKRHVEGK